MRRSVRALHWEIPVLFCTLLYWRGLITWFVQDDFGWLGLRHHVTDVHSLLWAMFAPLAQGTIRPWSERGFFLLFSTFFGLHPLPFRAFVFLNQFANIFLVIFLTRKMTRSALAALLAPLLWVANPALALPMAWTSAYNEIQCATFLLLSLAFFVRYTETEKRGYLWAEYGTFCLGFGSNELMVVFPALAAAYAWFFCRRNLKTTFPLFGISTLYVVADRLIAGRATGEYAMSFRVGDILSTLARYCAMVFSGLMSGVVFGWTRGTGVALMAASIAGIVTATCWRAYKKDYAPLFGLCWFVIVLAPLLLLHKHVTSYYVMIPSIGLSIAAAAGIAHAWEARSFGLAPLATALAGIYLMLSSVVSYRQMVWHFERAERARALVEAVMAVKASHPGKIVLLENVDEPLFWAAVYDRPFDRIFGWKDVLLVPENRALIPERREPLDGFYFPESVIRPYIANGAALVYAFRDGALHETTGEYARMLALKPAPLLDRAIDVGLPYVSRQIGEGWYAPDSGARWSRQQASVYLPGPARRNEKLYIHGWVNRKTLATGPLHVALTVGGCQAPMQTISQGSSEFNFDYALPPQLVGQERIEILVAMDRTTRVPPDPRDLGLVFGQFSIR